MKLKILFKKIYHLLKQKIKIENKIKFKLPNLDLLKTPSKNERKIKKKMKLTKPEFLEKILIRFWS